MPTFFNSTQFNIAGTETFRLGSRQVLGLWGSNLQNVPKKLRQLYVPKDGYKFVQTDQAGAEALIVAYLCKPGNYRNLFLHGINPHVFTALHIFKDRWKQHIPLADLAAALNAPIPDLPKLAAWKNISKIIKSSDDWQPSERYYFMSKKAGHAHNYDMKAPTFVLDMLKESEGAIVMSADEGNEVLASRAKLFKEIDMWHYGVQELFLSAKNGAPVIMRNLFGYPREFGGEAKDKTFKEAYAFVPQSTVGTITNIAFTKMQEYIEQNGIKWDMLNNCHDSMLTQCPIEEEMECARIQKLFMEQELTAPKGEKFRMKSETQSGFNWAPAKEGKNPNGLRTLAL